jgi:hypothetical protein
MPDHTIYLIGGIDDESGTIHATTSEGLCRIVFSYRDCEIEASSSDYFEAFLEVRLKLEQVGLIPFCYGASLNVFPSRMCRDMGSGMSAYRLTAGKTPQRTDLVRIFEFGHDVIPSSVENQKTFYAEWLQSPKG